MTTVVVTSPALRAGAELLSASGCEVVEPAAQDASALLDAAPQADAILCLLTDRVDRPLLKAGAGRLRVVANVAAGYDNIDIEAATDLGIAVCNTPGILDETTASSLSPSP